MSRSSLVTDAFNSNYDNHIQTGSIYYDLPVFAAEPSLTVEKTVETDSNLLEVLDTLATVSVTSTVQEEGGLACARKRCHFRTGLSPTTV